MRASWRFALCTLACCSSVSNTPTGSANAAGVAGLRVSSAYSVNTIAQVVVYLLPDPAGQACGPLRSRGTAVLITLNTDPNAVAGKTFPVASSASAIAAEVDIVVGSGDAGAFDFVGTGTVTFAAGSTRSELKGTFAVTDTSGNAISGSFDAPACNDG